MAKNPKLTAKNPSRHDVEQALADFKNSSKEDKKAAQAQFLARAAQHLSTVEDKKERQNQAREWDKRAQA